jgi:hypothetical protein
MKENLTKKEGCQYHRNGGENVDGIGVAAKE